MAIQRLSQLALLNLKRKLIRTIIMLLIVSFVSGTVLGASVFMSGMGNALKIGTYRLGADVLVVPEKNAVQAKAALLSGEPASFYMGRDILEKVRQIEGVRAASPQLFIRPATFTCCYNVEAFLIAFEPGTDFTITPWLQKNLKQRLLDEEVVTGSAMPVIPGDALPFFGTPFTVRGTLEPTGMKFFDQSVFMTMEAAYAMAANSQARSRQPLEIQRDRISAVLLQVSEGFTPERVAIRIEHDIDGVKAIASDEVTSTVRRQLGGLIKGIFVISAVVWMLGLLMMGFAFSMIVNERQREFGLLRAMGATRGQIFRLVVFEAVFISIAGGAAGLSIALSLLMLFKGAIVQGLRLPYLLPGPMVLIELIVGAMVFSVLTGLLSSLLPAVSAGKMEPYEAIRKGE